MEHRAAAGGPVNDIDPVPCAILLVNRLLDLLVSSQRDSRRLPAIESDDSTWTIRLFDFIQQRSVDCHVGGSIDCAIDDEFPFHNKIPEHKKHKGHKRVHLYFCAPCAFCVPSLL